MSDDTTSGEPVLYRETQRFRQWWLWLTVLVSAAIGWTGFLQQIVRGVPFGEEPTSDAVIWAVWLGLGVVLPAAFGSIRMRTTVRRGAVTVRFPPFPARTVDLDEVLAVATVEYKPVANYGGWGYRRTVAGDTAFIVSGKRGVRLALPKERHLLIGSQRPDELAGVIEDARRHA